MASSKDFESKNGSYHTQVRSSKDDVGAKRKKTPRAVLKAIVCIEQFEALLESLKSKLPPDVYQKCRQRVRNAHAEVFVSIHSAKLELMLAFRRICSTLGILDPISTKEGPSNRVARLRLR